MCLPACLAFWQQPRIQVHAPAVTINTSQSGRCRLVQLQSQQVLLRPVRGSFMLNRLQLHGASSSATSRGSLSLTSDKIYLSPRPETCVNLCHQRSGVWMSGRSAEEANTPLPAAGSHCNTVQDARLLAACGQPPKSPTHTCIIHQRPNCHFVSSHVVSQLCVAHKSGVNMRSTPQRRSKLLCRRVKTRKKEREMHACAVCLSSRCCGSTGHGVPVMCFSLLCV